MAIDIRQFHQTFFEESLESLELMESALLRLEQSPADREALNTVFRVVHSIKGGSATFGFGAVTQFSHELESFLEALRSGHEAVEPGTIERLLRARDDLAQRLLAARTGAAGVVAPPAVPAHSAHAVAHAPSPAAPPAHPDVPGGAWRIGFRPNRDLFRSGNDPLRILRELAELGDLRVEADAAGLPAWGELDPESCYLAWTLTLAGSVGREAIDDTFSWVTGDCVLSIAPLPSAERVSPADPPIAEPAAESIRVGIPKVDALINTVGELVITQSMLSQLAADFSPESLPRLLTGLGQLERNTRELQESVMRIRMLPLSFVFSRLPRIVRDISHQLGKHVELRISGDQTELDKTVIERIGDPILHLARNGIDHGIETPEERRAAGKPEVGTLSIRAYQRGGYVVIEIHDDGRGLPYERILAKARERGLIASDAVPDERELAELIFLPGLSTAAAVSDVSGRGVGLDVVRSNIRGLGGSVAVASQVGQGVCFTIRLPLTLAILDGLIVRVRSHSYILPLVSILESVPLRDEQVHRPAGGAEVVARRGEYLPLLHLHELFGISAPESPTGAGLMVVVESDGKKAGLHVDELLGQQQVVIKSLDTHYQRVEGVSGATILGDGTVAMILDVAGLTRLAYADAAVREGPVAAAIAAGVRREPFASARN